METAENMNSMFDGASSFNGDLSGWKIKKVKRMYRMFAKATDFSGDLSGWDVSNVLDMGRMFWGATSFNRDVIQGWDTSGVTWGYNLP